VAVDRFRPIGQGRGVACDGRAKRTLFAETSLQADCGRLGNLVGGHAGEVEAIHSSPTSPKKKMTPGAFFLLTFGDALAQVAALDRRKCAAASRSALLRAAWQRTTCGLQGPGPPRRAAGSRRQTRIGQCRRLAVSDLLARAVGLMMIEAMSRWRHSHLGSGCRRAGSHRLRQQRSNGSLGEMADVVNSGCSGTPKIFDRHGRDLAVNVPRIW
jgi:hypothetical protein